MTTTDPVKALQDHLTAVWGEWDKACWKLVDRTTDTRYRPHAGDLTTQSAARIDALEALAAALGVPWMRLHKTVLGHRHRGGTAGARWTGRPAELVNLHGKLGRNVGDAIQDAVLELAPGALVDQLPTSSEHRRAS